MDTRTSVDELISLSFRNRATGLTGRYGNWLVCVLKSFAEVGGRRGMVLWAGIASHARLMRVYPRRNYAINIVGPPAPASLYFEPVIT